LAGVRAESAEVGFLTVPSGRGRIRSRQLFWPHILMDATCQSTSFNFRWATS